MGMTADEGAQDARGNPQRRPPHIPVLLREVLAALAPKDGEIYIDGTFGAGGYTRALLDAAHCRVLALDRDPAAIRDGFPLTEAYFPRLTLMLSTFGELDRRAESFGQDFPALPSPQPFIHGVVLDLGVSSMQIDTAERGFSFQSDGPLDMRMSAAAGESNEAVGLSAADVIAAYDENDIANILYEFGEERRSRAIARAIVKARAETPILRTRQLADLVSRVLGGRGDKSQHPATRTFQGLRIFVNDELGELRRGLAAAERCLLSGGRLVVVTFHSLEDRIVKQFFASRSGRTPGVSRHLPLADAPAPAPTLELLYARALQPSAEEARANSRSRSAKLRAAVRTEAPPWISTGPEMK